VMMKGKLMLPFFVSGLLSESLAWSSDSRAR